MGYRLQSSLTWGSAWLQSWVLGFQVVGRSYSLLASDATLAAVLVVRRRGLLRSSTATAMLSALLFIHARTSVGWFDPWCHCALICLIRTHITTSSTPLPKTVLRLACKIVEDGTFVVVSISFDNRIATLPKEFPPQGYLANMQGNLPVALTRQPVLAMLYLSTQLNRSGSFVVVSISFDNRGAPSSRAISRTCKAMCQLKSLDNHCRRSCTLNTQLVLLPFPSLVSATAVTRMSGFRKIEGSWLSLPNTSPALDSTPTAGLQMRVPR
ncbi:uncharacterized protein EI97DRAFT_443384 [Westerdykella ornata]|uniref:Uncharacterized protein n=1 Tax=Westerdykella ornata TaxID=318751 RepID=A0A6A6JFY9_WESOR|nr:uncharacterized protein EI97DRAFT_443384 [Westerdykella ornata]KAF2275134.1 hypothetical protein EI97DRAFT_443384 [Westerdykella ornata]